MGRKQCQALARHQRVGGTRERRRQHEHVGLSQLAVECVHTGYRCKTLRRSQLGPAADADADGTERGKPPRGLTAESAGTHDQHPRTAYLAQRRVLCDEECLAPLRPALLIDRHVESAQEMEHAGHHKLTDRRAVNASGVRQQDVRVRNAGLQHASDAGGRRVDPPETAGSAKQIVRDAEAEIDLRVGHET